MANILAQSNITVPLESCPPDESEDQYSLSL